MISVITLTYKRKNQLQEAMQSFIEQDVVNCEMMIINDASDVNYSVELTDAQYEKLNRLNNNIVTINHPARFGSIIEKLRLGFSLANNDFMYRLDDDDLLSKNSLKDAVRNIKNNPGFDIYRSKGHHYFCNNVYGGRSSSINNGNIYTKKYIDRISNWQNKSFGEDNWLTFHNGAKIHEYEEISMLYRWGMGVYHVSGMGDVQQKEMFSMVDDVVNESGNVILRPQFFSNYYEQIELNDK